MKSSLNRLLPLAVLLTVFAVYLTTLYPTMGWVDCGEIAAGCYKLSVLHPTGYPLFTLLGNLATRIPLGTVVTRVNALVALLSSIAALFVFLTAVNLTRSRVVALVTTALFAFSATVWSNSVDAEVFSLTALFVALTIFMMTRDAERFDRALLFIAFLLGLALTNHMSYMSTFAGSIVFLMYGFRRELFRLRVLVPMALMFLLGLSPYVYLLVRSPAQPVLNWGDAHNLERLFWHLTGRQYQVWMFSLPFSEIMANLGKALGQLAQELYYVLVPVFIWGGSRLFKRRRSLFWFLLVIFLLNIFYAVNYSIPDIQSYYIPFMIAAFLATGVGLADIMGRMKRVPAAVFLVLALVPLPVNYRRAGAQGNWLAEDLARNHLAALPADAILMTTNWDIYSPLFYLREVEGVRRDICLLDKELFRRSWYIKGLATEYPWLAQRSKPEIDAYLHYLDQFEHNTLKDVKGIQDAFIAMINSFVSRNPDRRVFTTFDLRSDNDAKEIMPARLRVPLGLCYELSLRPTPDSFDYRQLQMRKPNLVLDERTRANLGIYERFATERGAYLGAQARREEAVATLEWVLEYYPGSPTATTLLNRLRSAPPAGGTGND